MSLFNALTLKPTYKKVTIANKIVGSSFGIPQTKVAGNETTVIPIKHFITIYKKDLGKIIPSMGFEPMQAYA